MHHLVIKVQARCSKVRVKWIRIQNWRTTLESCSIVFTNQMMYRNLLAGNETARVFINNTMVQYGTLIWKR